MIAAKCGAIVSIVVSRGPHGGPQASIYSAAKAAIIVFSQSLAQKTAGTVFGSTQSRPATPRRAGKSASLCAVRLAARRPAMMPGGGRLPAL
jgi:NAD(P)-dependent dehydrogenase (short-subunit alcohol dehydrogenase family)